MHFRTKLLILIGIIVTTTIITSLFVIRYFAVDNFIDFLNRQEISETLDPPPKITIKELAEKLNKDPRNLRESLQRAIDQGMGMREFLIQEGITNEKLQEILPPPRHGKSLMDWRQSLLTSPPFKKGSPEYFFITQILTSLLITGAIILIIMLLIGYYFSVVLSRPINHITESIRSIKDRNQALNIPVESEDEIGVLARTVNKLSAKLTKQEKIRNHFLADVSHEIKTPLTALKCYIEGIKDGVFKPNTELFEKIMNELDRVSHIVNELMHQARFASEELKLKKAKEDIVSIIETSHENNTALLNKKEQKAVIRSKGKIKSFLFDKEKILQVLQNIFSNFHKYAGKGKTLTIEVSQSRPYTTLVFLDNGEGVKKEDLQFIFEKFYQVDKARSGSIKERGLGVGLSVIKQIIDAHDGEVHIDSKHGKYFQIQIVLPNK